MQRAIVSALFLLFLSIAQAPGDIKISPHYLFISATNHRLISIYVSNDGIDEREVWVTSRYGYETSDDSGKIFIKIDTLAIDEPSAAGWIACFPKRFILRGGEGQTVRFMLTPPGGLTPGEYWSRIYVSSRLRSTPKEAAAPSHAKPGLSLLLEQSIPFHFRVGTVTTGVRIDSIATAITDTGLVVKMKLLRTGNASFWGTRTIQLSDRSGKNWLNWTHNTGVYKDITLVDKFNRTTFPPGEYLLSVRLHSDGRTDVPTRDLLRIEPVESTIPVSIP